MTQDMIIAIVAFLIVGSLGLIAALVLSGRDAKIQQRIDTLSGKEESSEKPETIAQIARVALPRMGKIIVPDDEAERTKLRARLIHAGLYQRQAMYIFLGVKLILLSLATVIGLGLTLTKVLPASQTIPISLVLFLFGMIGPSFWLDRRKHARQTVLRRALPDALDVLIICLEGGLSLQAGLKRVADELSGAHPQLGAELRIVDREIQLGLNAGEALNHFAERTNLEEALTLSSVISQSERFGASLVKSLRSHSETLRLKRKQHAEERAQKAATKMLVPTLLFIFPAVFIILLAPAAIQVQAMFAEGKMK
jgi:tight adherence protein C